MARVLKGSHSFAPPRSDCSIAFKILVHSIITSRAIYTANVHGQYNTNTNTNKNLYSAVIRKNESEAQRSKVKIKGSKVKVTA